MNIAVIIPCYNEEKTIAQAINEVREALPEAKIYVIDNNSSDNSINIVREKIALENANLACENVNPKCENANLARENLNPKRENVNPKRENVNLKCENVNLARENQKNPNPNLALFCTKIQGKGAVMRDAFRLIDADIYVMIDADTQYDASALPRALTHFMQNNLDMLNIAREVSDARIYRKWHGFGNRLISASASALFNKKINDMLSGYKILSKAFVKSFPAHSNGFEIETELSIFALQQNLRTDEITAPYKARPDGSFSKLNTFRDGAKIIAMILQLLLTERPLFVFGILSLISLLLCLVLGVPIVIEFFDTHKVPRFPTLFACVGFGIISILLLVAGFISSLVARNTKEARNLAYLAIDSKRSFELP